MWEKNMPKKGRSEMGLLALKPSSLYSRFPGGSVGLALIVLRLVDGLGLVGEAIRLLTPTGTSSEPTRVLLLGLVLVASAILLILGLPTSVGLALVLLLISPVMLLRAPVDIFPNINIPVISVIWTYSGLAPAEMSTRIVSIFERSLTTSVNNIEHIESQSLNGVAVVKVFLQPSANIDGAISEVIAEGQVGLKQFPAGITPPLVISYNASSVPILQLGLSGKGLSEQQLNDLG